MNKAETGLGKFVSKVSAVHTAVIGLAAYGFGRFVSAALQAGGALHDLSEKLNISTEALSALNYAAEQMGGSAEGMQNALQFMTRALGEAIEGNAEQVQAFDKLKISLDSIISLPVEQQFLAIVDALNQLPTAAEKASTAQAIFGRGARDLMAVIQGGTDEIIRFSDEAARSGAIVGSDTAASLDEAADSILSFGRQWENLKLNLVGVFAPAISGAMLVISEALRALRIMWHGVQLAIVGGMELIAQGMLKLAELANTVLPQAFEFDTEFIKGAIDSFAAEREKIQGKLRTLEGGVGGPLQRGESKEVAQNTNEANKKLEEQTSVLRQIAAGQPKLAAAGMR